MAVNVLEKAISSENGNLGAKYHIQTFNKIAQRGLDQLADGPYTVSDTVKNPDAIILRSQKLHGMTFADNLLAIGRAGAGVNNIPVDECTKNAVVVFNAPGANANAVKEMVLTGLLLASRNIIGGIEFAKGLQGANEEITTSVEQNKSRFAGSEIRGKRLGVIGLGAIGTMVANAAIALGMFVEGHDPYISVDWAWTLSSQVSKAASIEKMLQNTDFITLHVPLTDSTKGFLDKKLLQKVKKGAAILNFSRSEIIVEEDVLAALDSGQLGLFITDFPTKAFLEHERVICIPHLGASTREAEENCAVMIANQIKDYLQYGNIKNSVNMPNCALEPNGTTRIAIINENVPNMVGQITGVIANHGLNIVEMVNKSRGDLAYTLVDIDGTVPPKLMEKINQIAGVIRSRLIDLDKT